jgi:hypothetical protein
MVAIIYIYIYVIISVVDMRQKPFNSRRYSVELLSRKCLYGMGGEEGLQPRLKRSWILA